MTRNKKVLINIIILYEKFIVVLKIIFAELKYFDYLYSYKFYISQIKLLTRTNLYTCCSILIIQDWLL